jgi:hypothetical protein
MVFTWCERELEGRWNVMTNQVMMQRNPFTTFSHWRGVCRYMRRTIEAEFELLLFVLDIGIAC